MVMIPRPAGTEQHSGVGVEVGWTGPAAPRPLELADELEEAAVGDLLHLAWVHQPPHRHGAVVLHDRLHVLDRAHVHRHPPYTDGHVSVEQRAAPRRRSTGWHRAEDRAGSRRLLWPNTERS